MRRDARGPREAHPMRVTYSEIEDGFEFASVDAAGECRAIFDRESGKIYLQSDDLGDMGEALPDDLDDERYIDIPNRKELDLGKPLVMRFVRECLPNSSNEVQEIFSKRGAYRRFKAFLERRGALDQWYDYSHKAEEAALR